MPDLTLCWPWIGCFGEEAGSSLIAQSFCLISSTFCVAILEVFLNVLRLSSQLQNSSLAYQSAGGSGGGRTWDCDWRTSESSNMESLRRASISAWSILSLIFKRIIYNMSARVSFLGVSSQTDATTICLVAVATAYAGCFLMVSNHYVFRPKVEEFLGQWSQLGAVRQLLIDLITNLPLLSFLICTLVVNASDSSLSVVVYSDMSWSGLYVGLLAFRTQHRREVGNWKLMLIKSISLLGLIYGSIASHYLTKNYLVSLGVVLLLLYFINVTIDSHQEKFVAVMQYLFNYKPQNESGNEYQHTHKMITAEYLARNFPVSNEELAEKMRNYEKETRSIKLKTKSVVAQKLMRVALAVHLSKLKLQAKAKRDIRNYYGTFNGTVADKSRRLIIDKMATHEQFEPTQSELQNDVAQGHEQVNSCIFNIFPVKIFENSKFLSVTFSLVINLAFGVLLSLALFITDNLILGQYVHIFYGMLLLPLLPNVSKIDYFATMSLSSLWKYCLYGAMLSFNCLTNGSSQFTLALSGTLTFSSLLQLISICLLTYMLVAVENCRYRLLFVWAIALLVNIVFIFKDCS